MKGILFILLLVPVILYAQTRIPISNNMIIGSNSDIKFIPDNYTFTDPGLDGVIKINNAHDIILDGDSCTVNGSTYVGYLIKINNSQRITIRNFDSVFKYKYAVYITNSSQITINGNVFSGNKVDSSGWIDVWANYNLALGGGVMMYQSRSADIFNNRMKSQNDGVALYHCDSIRIHDNDFAWNTSYGVRMFWTDSCEISNNMANHINRPLTDPSDCAAILLIVSNNNRVVHNDFSYSGDGIFLGQYQQSAIPNNNFFGYNECSYSPHNAIEATFADGNVYRGNRCNYSPYGFWLGYSFNSVIDSNEVIGNYNSGIAIDRGFNNLITNNSIVNNPYGIELWKGSPITGYENQNSQDYQIADNNLEGNEIAISATNTSHMAVSSNAFNYNQQAGVFLAGTSATNDTIADNMFRFTTIYHIKNYTPTNIFAPDNVFMPSDTAIIRQKIYDKTISPSRGAVLWYPNAPGPQTAFQELPPCDMAEAPSVWYAYGDPGYGGKRVPEYLGFDSTEKVIGSSSVKLVSGRGFDVGLNYRPAGDSFSQWSLTTADTLYFWVRTIKNPVIGFQNFSIRIGDAFGNYYKYTAPASYLTNAHLLWKHYKVPLSGGSGYTRTAVGTMSLNKVNYVEFHPDTWDYGFTMWVDGVQFEPCSIYTGLPSESMKKNALWNFPNPVNGTTTISWDIVSPGPMTLRLFDLSGRLIRTLTNEFRSPGSYRMPFNSEGLVAGVYILRLDASGSFATSKMIIAR